MARSRPFGRHLAGTGDVDHVLRVCSYGSVPCPGVQVARASMHYVYSSANECPPLLLLAIGIAIVLFPVCLWIILSSDRSPRRRGKKGTSRGSTRQPIKTTEGTCRSPRPHRLRHSGRSER
jgi:hypothetical protein